MPRCDTEAMNLHLAEIATQSHPARTPPSSSIKMAAFQPARRSAQHHAHPAARQAPRTEPPGKRWQFMRENWLSNRVFDSDQQIVDFCREAWNSLSDQPWRIMSIGSRERASRF
jgi:hypothetical protein